MHPEQRAWLCARPDTCYAPPRVGETAGGLLRLRSSGAALRALVAAIVAWASPALADEPVARVSEELLTAGEAWEEPGFRIQLQVGTEDLKAAGALPAGSGLSLTAEPGFRLSRWWSISADLTYTIVGGGMQGLRWSGTFGPTFHPWSGLFLTAGAGYGGLMVNAYQDFFTSSCTGAGFAIGAKAGWLFPVGSLFATGPVVGTQTQWVRCSNISETGGGDPMPETEGGDWGPWELGPAAPKVWRHQTFHIGWSLAWR